MVCGSSGSPRRRSPPRRPAGGPRMVQMPCASSLTGHRRLKCWKVAGQYPGAMLPTINMGIPGASSSVTGTTGKRVLLAEPRGYCAGVDRAVETVERALEKHGAPVYVRKRDRAQPPRGRDAGRGGRGVRRRDRRGARGAIVVFSAHGVRRRCTRPRPNATCKRSTPPARWSPRCTTRPNGSPGTTTTSC